MMLKLTLNRLQIDTWRAGVNKNRKNKKNKDWRKISISIIDMVEINNIKNLNNSSVLMGMI